MPKIIVLLFNVLSEFAQTFILSISKLLNARRKERTMLAAVQATEERLTARRYLIQISAHLAFSYTKCEPFAS